MDLVALQVQECHLVLLHLLGQDHLLVLVSLVPQVYLVFLACLVFLFLGNLEDQEVLAFLVTLAILDLVVQQVLVALVVQLARGGLELPVVPL